MQPAPSRSRAIAASNILFAGFAVSVLVWWFHSRGQPLPAGVKPVKNGVLVGGYLLVLGYYYAIRLGKPWAKYLLLVLFIGGLVVNLTYHPERLLQTWRTSWLAAAGYAVGQGTTLWALVLLFRRARLQTG